MTKLLINQTYSRSIKLSFIAVFSLVILAPFFPVHADSLNEAYLRLDRMKTGTATGGTVCLMMGQTGQAEAHVVVQFPTSFTVNGTASNWTVTTTPIPSGSTAMPGVNTAEDVSAQSVRFPIGDISDNTTLYCFNFSGTTTLTTGGTGPNLQGVITVTDSSDVTIDATNYAVAVISDDQVVIDATVPPLFSFALGSNTTSFTTDLDPSSIVSATGVTVSIGTNAANGWVTWLKSANQGLLSTAAGQEIVTAGVIDATTTEIVPADTNEYYQLDVELTTDGAGTGTINIDDEYDGDATHGGTFDADFQEIALSTGTTDGDILTMIARAVPSALRAAATDYTDTWTIVGAANF